MILNMKKTWSNVIYMPCTKAENNFVPELPKETPDIIYLCFPNNPTGSTITKAQLQEWVDYANKVGAVIIYDAAYEAYISEDDVPHTIYECEGARTCAIELTKLFKKCRIYRSTSRCNYYSKRCKMRRCDITFSCGQDVMEQNITVLHTLCREPVKLYILKKERRSSKHRSHII